MGSVKLGFWARRVNGAAVLITKGPHPSGDGLLYSPVTGGQDLSGDVGSMGTLYCGY